MIVPIQALLLGTFAAIAASKSVYDPDEALASYGRGQESLDAGFPGVPPHRPLPWPGSGNETIYDTLRKDAEYTKLVKAINWVDGIVSILNDSSADITFFAVPNSALHRHKHCRWISDVTDIASPVQAYDLADIVDLVEQFQTRSTDDKDDDKEKCKKKLKKIIRAVLSYHILPSKFEATKLADNNTLATNLVLPEDLGARPLRIRVTRSLLSPLPTINIISKVNRPNGPASNGIIHGIDHPLVPPPSAFQGLFMAPSAFSTFTSAIQRVGLTDSLDLRFEHGDKSEKGSVEGAAAVTVFAPTNHAFAALPLKLKLFLFSPFGARVLKKLLQFHIVPDFVFHTDYQYNNSESSSAATCGDHKTFEISKLGPLGANLHLLKFASYQHDDLFACGDIMPKSLYSGEASTCTGQREKTSPPSGPFQFNIKHQEEILAMDTDAYEALTEVQQNHIAEYLALYDVLTNGMQPSDGDEYHIPSDAVQLHHEPIISFELKLPTALTNHSLHARVEKYNLTIPIPGPHKPHKITTKFTVNSHPVCLEDLVALNGAVHVVNRLLDPREHHHDHCHHLPGHDSYLDKDAASEDWEDWEDWLPKWAAEN